jgi:hypothetical protein
MVRTEALDDAQAHSVVMAALEPSEYTTRAVNCCWQPAGMAGEEGETVTLARVGGAEVTVRVAYVPVMDP